MGGRKLKSKHKQILVEILNIIDFVQTRSSRVTCVGGIGDDVVNEMTISTIRSKLLPIALYGHDLSIGQPIPVALVNRLLSEIKYKDFEDTDINDRLALLGIITFNYTDKPEDCWYKDNLPTDEEIVVEYDEYVKAVVRKSLDETIFNNSGVVDGTMHQKQ